MSEDIVKIKYKATAELVADGIKGYKAIRCKRKLNKQQRQCKVLWMVKNRNSC